MRDDQKTYACEDCMFLKLIAQYVATGRTATRYPRKRAISVDGRTMPEAEAIIKMREAVP